MKKIFTVLFFAILLAFQAEAQEFAIKKIEITAEQVVVHYDLIDTTRYRTYTIRVFSSVDKFLAPLTKLSGDAGLEVKPGVNKKIVWNSKAELGASFIGNVELEVRGRVYIPFIRLVGFEDLKEVKRTKPFIIKWTGGSSQNVLNFQLYNKSDKLVHTFPNAPNELQHRLAIPKNVKPGKGYYFKIADSKNADQVVISAPFTVKAKYPIYVKAVPVLALGGVAYIIINSLDKNNDLGFPTDPPSGKN